MSRPITERPFRSTEISFETLQEEFTHQHTNTTDEKLQNVLEHHSPEENFMNSLTSPGITENRNRTIIKFVAKPRPGIHMSTKYVWDSRAENIRLGNEASSNTNPRYQFLSNEFPASCLICG